MFEKGDRIHLHDGRVVQVRRAGVPKKLKRPARERSLIRGFVRAAIVDCLTGEEQASDWHENTVTVYGHQMIVRNYAGLHSNSSTAPAAVIADLGLARFWAVGYHSFTVASSDSSKYSTQVGISGTEWGLTSSSAATAGNTGVRATVSNGTQCLDATWTLSQSFQYASSHLAHAATVNCIAQYHHSSVASGTAHSLATFASSTKGTTQALNVTYNWLFST